MSLMIVNNADRRLCCSSVVDTLEQHLCSVQYRSVYRCVVQCLPVHGTRMFNRLPQLIVRMHNDRQAHIQRARFKYYTSRTASIVCIVSIIREFLAAVSEKVHQNQLSLMQLCRL